MRTAKNRERRRQLPERDRAYQAKYRLTHRAKTLIRHAKRRASKMNVRFDLDQHIAELQRRIDIGVCELTKIPFNLKAIRSWDSPSLDRIKPENGYVLENVRVVCLAINCALGNWGKEVLLQVVSAFRRQQQKEE